MVLSCFIQLVGNEFATNYHEDSAMRCRLKANSFLFEQVILRAAFQRNIWWHNITKKTLYST
jgi:hypothetical protein